MAILLVDDDVRHRGITQRVLESLGYQVKTAGSGKEALEILQENSIKTLVTDNNMPGMTGVRLIEIVRPQLPKLRIFLTSGRQPNYIPEGVVFLPKPVSREEWESFLKEE